MPEGALLQSHIKTAFSGAPQTISIRLGMLFEMYLYLFIVVTNCKHHECPLPGEWID